MQVRLKKLDPCAIDLIQIYIQELRKVTVLKELLTSRQVLRWCDICHTIITPTDDVFIEYDGEWNHADCFDYWVYLGTRS